MPIKRTRYDVAYIPDEDRTQVIEEQIEVWGVDELRAEQEARRQGARLPQVVDGKIMDLGDFNKVQALQVWAALVRLGRYDKKAIEFCTADYVGADKVKADGDQGDELDPTRPEVNTDSD